MYKKETYTNSKPVLRQDALWVGKHPLIYCNEEPWIKKGVRLLVKKVKPRNVLEIGFGLGFTATQFQECGIKRHVIVEPNKYIYRKALAWRKKYPKKDIEIHNLFSWEFKTRERFDLVYDDRYDPVKIIRTMKEYEKLCKKNTYVAIMPWNGWVKSPGKTIYYEVNDKKYSQPLMLFEKNKKKFSQFFYGNG